MAVLPDVLVLIGRLFFGMLLVVSGWEKMADYAPWRELVTKMDLFPIDWVGPLSAALPGIEVVVGLALLLGFWTREAAVASGFLFVLFAAVMAVLLWKGTVETCGCFGADDAVTVSSGHLAANVIGAAVLFALAYAAPGFLAVDRLLGH